MIESQQKYSFPCFIQFYFAFVVLLVVAEALSDKVSLECVRSSSIFKF